MTIKIDLPMKGRYKLTVMKNGEIKRETGWFDNLITDNGMNLIATNANWNSYLSVGSGSTTPANSDVALGSRVATSSSGTAMAASLDTTNRYLILTKTVSFLAGAAAGTLAEVGLGSGNTGTSLFSRALILDSGGSPTTITVLSDEDLVVVYQLWIKQPTGDFYATVGGKSCTIRACGVASTHSSYGWAHSSSDRGMFAPQTAGGADFSAYSGTIGSITATAPTGTDLGAAGTLAATTYVADSWTSEGKFTFATAVANSAPIKSFAWNFGPTRWQMEMDSTITKTALQTLRVGVSLSWSRDSGPA